MNKRQYKISPRELKKIYIRVAAFVALSAALFSSYLAQRPINYSRVEVSRVIDGDTIELKNGKLARYIGIDCPETRRKTEKGWVKARDPFGEEAKRFNDRMVSGRVLRCESDIQREDKYKRLLVYCFVKDGAKEQFIQAELLRQGLAYFYPFPPNVRYADILLSAMNEAKENRKGVWSQDLLISSAQASDFIGQRKMVEGIVKKARSTKNITRLGIEGLNIIIFKSDIEAFLNSGISPATFYKSKKVRVFGLIKEYKGEPEMIVSHPSQIEIVE